MIIYVFGNPDLKVDSLPIKILPPLQKKFPEIEFRIVDPNEEWEIPKELVLIDTVQGIKEVKLFNNLEDFSPAPNITMHDFDAYANLRYLEKLGKLKNIKIIGVPNKGDETEVLTKIIDIIHKNFSRRKLLRLPDFDYSQEGWYFVTICTKDRKCLFGVVKNGEMILNEIGKIVDDEWYKTPEIRKNISLDVFVVMPNHLHGIIVIEFNNVCQKTSVGAYCNTPLQLMNRYIPRSPTQTIGSIIRGFKSASTTKIKKYFTEKLNQKPPEIIWQRNYYEHVIRNEKSLSAIQNYIINNPLKWEFDPENPKRAGNYYKQ